MPRRILAVASLLAVLVGLTASSDASAQALGAQGTGKKPGSVEGTPLDTILSTRLWTTPPPAQDFVRETRPDPKSLEYAPLVGQDPDRPKPRDAANVKALQAELEGEIQKNEGRAQALGGVPNPTMPQPARHLARKAKTGGRR